MSEKIIQLNEAAIKGELEGLVRQSVEYTLNAMLDEEADRLTKAITQSGYPKPCKTPRIF